MSLESPLSRELVELPTVEIKEDENEFCLPYIDDSLRLCLALTPDPMPTNKEPMVEVKELPKNLRYEFLDNKVNSHMIVNATLNEDKIVKLLVVLRRNPKALGYKISDLKGISPSVVCTKSCLKGTLRPLKNIREG